jgi:hypothetical protein
MTPEQGIGSKYKLKIVTKKLSSGRFQVRFTSSTRHNGFDFYGYILVDPKTTLKETIHKIEEGLDYYLSSKTLGLFRLQEKLKKMNDMIVFHSRKN